jgi:hypothetical protein
MHRGAAVFIEAYDAGTTLELRNITMKNGYSIINGDSGGAIFGDGGAKITIISSTFEANHGDYNGGAFDVRNGAELLIISSVFVHNGADGGSGGAIRVYKATATITDSTFTGNTAINPNGPYYNGGGAIVADDGAVVHIGRCNFIKGVNTTKGYNDIHRQNTAVVTFDCTNTTIGGFTMTTSDLSVLQLPPATEIVRCEPRYLCDVSKHACVQALSGSSFTVCNASCSCVVPLNCGLHNHTTVCSHLFQGCNVCAICCKGYIKNDNDCSGCVDTECKKGHTECCK